MKKLFAILFSSLLFPAAAKAHEPYVLTPDELQLGMIEKSQNHFSVLLKKENLPLGIILTLGAAAALTLSVFFRRTRLYRKIDKRLLSLESWAELLVRIALAIALFYAARQSVLFGPELAMSDVPFPEIVPWILYILSALLIIGFNGWIIGVLGLLVYVLALIGHGVPALTYLDYAGVFVALLLAGCGTYSLDARRRNITAYKADLLRISLGLSMLFSAIYVKFLHAPLSLAVVEKYHLSTALPFVEIQPDLFVAGAAITEALIGLALLFGFQSRLLMIISIVMFLSAQIYFKEIVWPHLILYALAVYIIVTDGGRFTLDRWIDKKIGRKVSSQ